METEQIRNLKTTGENLTIFILNLLNGNKNNALHELFKEEEPQSIAELCDQLRNYTLNLTFNYPSFPKLPPEQDATVASAIQQLDTLVGQFHDKYYRGIMKDETVKAKETTLQDDLRALAQGFIRLQEVLDRYYNYLLTRGSAPHETTKAKL